MRTNHEANYMTPDEIRVVVERTLKFWAENPQHDPALKDRDDGRVVAALYRLWLAEHPADDGEPAPISWLRSFKGWVIDPSSLDSALFEIGDGNYLVIEHDGSTALQVNFDKGVLYIVIPLADVKTRGDFRRLTKAFGIDPEK